LGENGERKKNQTVVPNEKERGSGLEKKIFMLLQRGLRRRGSGESEEDYHWFWREAALWFNVRRQRKGGGFSEFGSVKYWPRAPGEYQLQKILIQKKKNLKKNFKLEEFVGDIFVFGFKPDVDGGGKGDNKKCKRS